MLPADLHATNGTLWTIVLVLAIVVLACVAISYIARRFRP